MFQICFKGAPRKISGFFKEDSMMLQESFKSVSKKIEGCFNGALSGFQRCLKEVQWVFEESFKGVSRMFQGGLGCYKED